jgi:TatD DNase family protein
VVPIELVDTHCHIHEAQFELHGDDPVRARWLQADKGDPDAIIADAAEQGVVQLLCVGTTPADSALAVDFVGTRQQTWASIGIHPHEAQLYAGDPTTLEQFAALAKREKVVAVGECGFDFYYNHSPKPEQEKILRFQIELALQHDLPMIFHIRDAFDDFWRVFDDYPRANGGIRGVVHSFTAHQKQLDEALVRGLYIGLNGIMTFTKDGGQLAAAKAVPSERLLLETDAPYLTPAPYRGTICEPKHVRVTLEFLAGLRGEAASYLAASTTANARRLFNGM